MDTFQPKEECEDIQIVTVTGLGRGRGFAVKERQSILELDDSDEILERISEATLGILNFLVENDVLTNQEIVEGLGLQYEDD